MIVSDVQRHRDSACQLHCFGAWCLRMKSLRRRFCQLRRSSLHFRGPCQFQHPHYLLQPSQPLMPPSDFGFKLREIRRRHLAAGTDKFIDLILNFTRLGFQSLIFCGVP